MKKTLLGAVALSLAIGTGAHAQDAGAARPDPLGDKVIVRTEAQAAAEARFAQMDANKDGQLTADEMKAAFAARAGERAGATGDRPQRHRIGGEGMRGGRMGGEARGPLTKQAFVDRMLARFDRMDGDHDGKVTKAERDTAQAAMRQRWEARAAERAAQAPADTGGDDAAN